MERFKFHFSYRVGIADINYGGHVANASVLNFFQDARIAFLATLGPYSEMDLGGCGLIMSEAHVFYLAEMFLGDQLLIGVQPRQIKRAAFALEYRIERDGQLTAKGETPLICFDYDKHKPTRMPASFRTALFAYASGQPDDQ